MTQPAADPARSPDDVAALLADLSGTLAEEYEALAGRDIERLEAVVERKAELVTALEAAASALLRPGGPPAKLEGLRELAEQCLLRNQTNGGAIAMTRGMVGTLLETLYGVSRETRTYSSLGRIDSAEATRSVARA